MEPDATPSTSAEAAAGRSSCASTHEVRRASKAAAADDDDVYGAAFNAERPSLQGIDEPWPRARRAGGYAVRATVVATFAALFWRLAASHPRATLALLALTVAANRWLQARAHATASMRASRGELQLLIAEEAPLHHLPLQRRTDAFPCVAPPQRAFDVGTRFAFSLHSPPDSFVVAPEDVLGWGPFKYRAAPRRGHAR